MCPTAPDPSRGSALFHFCGGSITGCPARSSLPAKSADTSGTGRRMTRPRPAGNGWRERVANLGGAASRTDTRARRAQGFRRRRSWARGARSGRARNDAPTSLRQGDEADHSAPVKRPERSRSDDIQCGGEPATVRPARSFEVLLDAEAANGGDEIDPEQQVRRAHLRHPTLSRLDELDAGAARARPPPQMAARTYAARTTR
jgi:hypothetical protein